MSFFSSDATPNGTFAVSTTSIDMRYQSGACPYCSTEWSATFHLGPCPRVKAIEYFPNGTIKRVEFNE